MEDKEKAFCSSLNAEYLALQEQLGDLMRTGFMRLSSARYAMGADRVSLLQLPATMTATTRLSQGDGEIEVVKMIGPSKLLHKKTFAAGPSAGKAPEAANTDSKGDLLAELGAKYGCDFDRDTVVRSTNEECSPRGDPLEWFGTLVSPNLRQSQQDFAAALQLIVELANARKKILDGITLFEQKE